MKCFKCPEDFIDPEHLFSHIKNVHNIRGRAEHVCSLCFNTFMDSSRFKRHVETCFLRRNVQVNNNQVNIALEEEIYNILIGQDNNVDILNLKESLMNAALKLVLKMGAKMYFPRTEVFETIADIASFVSTIIEGKPFIISYYFCVANAVGSKAKLLAHFLRIFMN